jgi:hypothetical protein
MSLDDVLLVPARDESVHTSLPDPLSLVDRAEQFVATYQGDECNSNAAVDSFMESLKISREDQVSIEKMTKGQFINQKYRQYRRCMITGSVIHQVNSRMRSIQSGKVSDANRLVGMCMGTGKPFGGNAATSYGHANEKHAAKSYFNSLVNLHENIHIHECGLLVYKDYSFIGGSMDRFRTCKCHPPRPVEIKCPSTMANKPKGSFGQLPFLQETEGQTRLLVNPNHQYHSQVQCYLALCGMEIADLVIWSPQETITISIKADPEFWSNILTNCIYFFRQFLAPAMLDKSSRTNISSRERFLLERICHKCKQLLPEAENLATDEDASVMCECSCNCSMWFHWRCSNYSNINPEGGADAPKWYCPNCVNKC